MADQHEAMQLMFALPDRFEECQDALGRYALGFRCAARELAGAGQRSACAASRNKREQPQSCRPDPYLFEKRSAIGCHVLSI